MGNRDPGHSDGSAKKVREQRNEYFRQQAIEKAIEKSREKKLHGEE